MSLPVFMANSGSKGICNHTSNIITAALRSYWHSGRVCEIRVRRVMRWRGDRRAVMLLLLILPAKLEWYLQRSVYLHFAALVNRTRNHPPRRQHRSGNSRQDCARLMHIVANPSVYPWRLGAGSPTKRRNGLRGKAAPSQTQHCRMVRDWRARCHAMLSSTMRPFDELVRMVLTERKDDCPYAAPTWGHLLGLEKV